MMCLFSPVASEATGVPPPNFAYNSLDSPESSDSSTGSDHSSTTSSKSPPQLSPQIRNNEAATTIFVDTTTMLASPPMAMLTPQIRKSVPFTFCNMRPNIFDVKKKRGRKKKCEECHGHTIHKAYGFERPCPLRKRKFPRRSESLDYYCSKSLKLDESQRRASDTLCLSNNDFEDEITEDYDSSSDSTDELHLQIDEDEDEIILDQEMTPIMEEENPLMEPEEQDPLAISDVEIIDSKELVEVVVDNLLTSIVSSMNLKYAVVPLMDLFHKTPLNGFQCFGCSKSYTIHDTFSVNLKCQTMLITCSRCNWWTQRSIALKAKHFQD